MNKKRAAGGAVIGLALTASGVFAASSQAPSSPNPVSVLAQDHSAVGGTNDNHGGAVSTLAKTTNDTATTTTPTTITTDTTTTAGTQGAHGAAVSAVAQDQTAVGGTNDNHGGAVSLVASGTHDPASAHGKSAGKSQAGVHKPTH